MGESLIERIRAYATSQASPPPYAIVQDAAVAEGERRLGFALPDLLKACYVQVGNGGFGPGYGLIGLEGGHESDYGHLIQTYDQLKGDWELEGREWPAELLPFCEWGCNIFSCVDCHDPRQIIHTFENFATRPQGYSLDRFFELWMNGTSILDYEPGQVEQVKITNPFTGKKTAIFRRKRD